MTTSNSTSPNPALQDPASVRDEARNILAQPEFRSEHRGWLGRIYNYLIHPTSAISDGWNWIAGHLPWNTTAAGTLAWFAVIAVVVLVVTLLTRLARSAVRDEGIQIEMAPIFSSHSAEELLQMAAALEAKREWREAIRTRYSALIARLGASGIVRRQAGRTTGEYVREVEQNAPTVLASFSEATLLFESVWYGNVTTDQELANRFRGLVDAVFASEHAA